MLWPVLALVLSWVSPADAKSPVSTNNPIAPAKGIVPDGHYNFFGEKGRQPAYGIFKINDELANFNDGADYEWVGRQFADPMMTFQFSTPVTINQVGIDFGHARFSLNFSPVIVNIGGTDFTLNPSTIRNAHGGTIFFNGNWTGTTLKVDLRDCNFGQRICV
ncbi:MAG: hypothetical protein ACREOZ_04090, partial [Gloeomargaritales cyanobacterium]